MKPHLLVLLAGLSVGASGQSPNQPQLAIAGKAELLNTLKSPTIKVGDLFYLRTTEQWHYDDCTIPSHTTITGHVESLTPPGYDTILAIRFSDVPCTESNSRLMTPVLEAIKAPDPDRYLYNNGASQNALFRGMFPSEMDANTRELGSRTNSKDAWTSSAYGADILQQLNDVVPTEKPMRIGEVRGYRGIELTIPAFETDAAKLTSQRKIVLDRDTEFAFAYNPAQPAFDPATLSPAPTSPAFVKPVPAPTPPPEQPEDVCASSGCKQLAAAPETTVARALWAISLVDLGYQLRPGQLIVGLDSSVSVHFLGEDQILLAFTRHVLVPRSAGACAWPVSTPRSVRGVLISRADGHVLRVKDWTVSDDIGPFVWSSGSGIVLAHVGHDLVRFGRDLTIEQRFPLAGPLLLVSASPRGNLLLAATVHEKHTEQEHAQIAKFVGPGLPVEEDYDLTGLNDAFQVTGARRVTVKPLRPALLQNSIVGARQISATEWLLEESTWEGQTRQFAHFRSTCPLEIQSFPGDLLFIQGCKPMEANKWYRVLNARGATLFKGSGPSTDFIQHSESSYDGRLFAIALSHFNTRPVDRTTRLQIGDFTNLTVTVYDTATGNKFFAAHPPKGSAQEDTFSLSPSGSALAVLTSGSLQLFPVPAFTAKN